MNPIKKYVNAIEWRLRLPWSVRRRIMTDLAGDITARLEEGKSYEQVMEELGSPEQVAAEFNAQFGEKSSLRKSLWQWVFLAGVILCGLSLLKDFILQQKASSIGIIGGADGPTAIYITTTALCTVWPLLAGFVAAFLLAKSGKNAKREWYLAAVLVAAGGLVLFLRDMIVCVNMGGGGLYLLLWPHFWLPVAALYIGLRQYKKASK